MLRRVPLLFAVALGGAACSDQSMPISSALSAPATGNRASDARERLARALATALANPATRSAVKRRLDASNAPEGKLQFQALASSEHGALLTALGNASASNATALIADLDAARGLELYLPVPAQRSSWTGDDHYLVATAGRDADAPVAYDSRGRRLVLDRTTPPDIPVLALVPQEIDFTRGHPEMVMSCVDLCTTGDPGSTGGGDVTPAGSINAAAGLYLVRSHFLENHESWLKGAPEFEYHVYGLGDDGKSVELACTGENQAGIYRWDQNDLDWIGSVMLLSDADYNAYQLRHPGAPIRIEAWEDDDEACVDHADGNTISSLVTAVDDAYKSITSGKVDPWYIHGIKAAPSIFNLVASLHNIILTNDDFIGNAVEGSITGDAPTGANWVLKTNGTVTTGWFTTMRVQ